MFDLLLEISFFEAFHCRGQLCLFLFIYFFDWDMGVFPEFQLVTKTYWKCSVFDTLFDLIPFAHAVELCGFECITVKQHFYYLPPTMAERAF